MNPTKKFRIKKKKNHFCKNSSGSMQTASEVCVSCEDSTSLITKSPMLEEEPSELYRGKIHSNMY